VFRILFIAVDVVSVGAALIPAIFLICRKDDIKTLAMKLCLGLYLIAVLSATGVPSVLGIHWDPEVQLIPLVNIVGGTSLYLKTSLLNVVLFLPLGALLPMIWKEFRDAWAKTAAAGLALSAFIEFLQLFNFRATDVDDLLMNTAGAVLGWLMVRAVSAGETAERGNGGRKELLIIAALAFFAMFFVQPMVQPFFSGILF